MTFVVVIVSYRVEKSFGNYNFVTVKFNFRLGSTNDFTFLIFIIILLFARNVNRTDDISVTIVDIEKLRTS